MEIDSDTKVGYVVVTGIEDKIKAFFAEKFPEETVEITFENVDSDPFMLKVNGSCLAKIPSYFRHDYDKNFRFYLRQMPGNCGILISFYMEVRPGLEGKGLAQFLQGIKEEIAKLNGYSQMYCTTVSTNDPQNHILEKFGWKKVNTFINRRSGNTCFEWIKEIK